jgi:hypothetical protein
MYIIEEKYTNKKYFVTNENELFDWWSFTAVDEISWKDLIDTVNKGYPVYLKWYCVEKFSGDSIPPKIDKFKQCNHPNKYKNVISKALVFWVCPDCKKEVKGN